MKRIFYILIFVSSFSYGQFPMPLRTPTPAAGIAPFALINSTADGSSTIASTTPAINTTGGKLIMISTTYLAGGSMTVTDSYSNTWTALTQYSSGSVVSERLFYCINPTVGSGHTFTATSSGNFPGLRVLNFSAGGTITFDSENGASNAAAGTTAQPGSVTPSQNNCLVVTGINFWTAASATIDQSFIITDQTAYSVGITFGAAAAYLIQTTAGAVNPTWTMNTSATETATSIAVFKNN